MTLQFEPISLEKQKAYLKMLAQTPQVASDYSFINLWAWAEDYGLSWAWEDNCVWIRQSIRRHNVGLEPSDGHARRRPASGCRACRPLGIARSTV